jgi:hypothetical protein
MKEKFDDKNLDQLFHDKLSGEETVPREIVWTKISEELGKAGKRPVAWIWWLSGIILILGIGSWFGISAYRGNKLAQNKTITGWNVDSNESDWEKVPYDYNGGDTGVISIEGGAYAMGQDSAAGAKTKDGYDALNDGHNDLDPDRPYDAGADDQKKKSFSAQKKQVNGDEKKEQVISRPIIHDQTKVNAEKEKQAIHFIAPPVSSGELPDETHDKLPENTGSSTAVQENHEPASASEEKNLSHGDSIPAKKEIVSSENKDSVIAQNDTSAANPSSTITPDEIVKPLPIYFASLHGAIEAGKILNSQSNEYDLSSTDVRVYNEEKIGSLLQQTYSYGGRFGWFITKRISLTAGAYYSMYETNTNEGQFKFNHNQSYIFTMHSPTSSVNCASSKFDHDDSNGPLSDTFYIHIQSKEKYEYVNLQLGVSFYALRTKHFGIYGTLFSNEAFLSKQAMTLTVPHSGKTFSYSGEQLSGMNKFVLGGQTGVGIEWLPFGNFGVWAEPSFYFAGNINRKNVISLHPGGMKYLAGIAYHF